MIFFFVSHLPFTDIVLWATVKARWACRSRPAVSGAHLTLAVPYETPVGPSLGAGAQHLVLSTFRLAQLQPFLCRNSNLIHRHLLKNPLPSGLSPNVLTLYKSCYDLTLPHFPVSLPIVSQWGVYASSSLNYFLSPKPITHSFIHSTNTHWVLNTYQVLEMKEMNKK